VPADEVAPPRVVTEFLAPELEQRVELERHPARLVAPVLEDRLSGLQQLLAEGRIEAVEPGQQDDRMAAGAGHRHGVELQVAVALDDPVGRRPRSSAISGGTARQAGPLRLEQPAAGERQPPRRQDRYGLHGGHDGMARRGFRGRFSQRW
jgi:hypothetical protein